MSTFRAGIMARNNKGCPKRAAFVAHKTGALRWRWRESNPRPESSTRGVYKLSRSKYLTGPLSSDRLWNPPADSSLDGVIGISRPHPDFVDAWLLPLGKSEGQT